MRKRGVALDAQTVINVVRDQIGREPALPLALAAECREDRPVVIATHPLAAGRPFPTLYYVVCPCLNRKVTAAETAGSVRLATAEIKRKPLLREEVLAAGRRYARDRWHVLDDLVRSTLGPSARTALRDTGVAGTYDLLQVKCLHAHLAHFLAGDANPIGWMVWREIKDGHGCRALEAIRRTDERAWFCGSASSTSALTPSAS